MTEKKPHSIEYMGEARNFWWNDDYLELLAKRLNLVEKSVLVDVGCGYGLMGFLLSKFMKKNAKIHGFDLEKEHIAKAKKLAAADHSGKKFSFKVADAYAIPLEDDFSDITICQTLLIHLKDPQRAIKEMIRVTKPGGLIVAFEPNNMASALTIDQMNRLDIPVEEMLEDVEIMLRYEKGKMKLGEGFNSLGDVVPELFHHSGLRNIKVWLSDKGLPIIPPYNESDEMTSRAEQFRTFIKDELGTYNYDEALKYHLAGGGNKKSFDNYWKKNLKRTKQISTRLKKGTYVCAGGSIFYIVAGIK
ncbi:MAG TPA: class I SAM-dependent methyltransferase [bacterium]|nr:class I SAM-dependent methyltransferase [bacterium]HPS28723.1 class I SAM-dependent methyltransferase [bacterium]